MSGVKFAKSDDPFGIRHPKSTRILEDDIALAGRLVAFVKSILDPTRRIMNQAW